MRIFSRIPVRVFLRGIDCREICFLSVVQCKLNHFRDVKMNFLINFCNLFTWVFLFPVKSVTVSIMIVETGFLSLLPILFLNHFRLRSIVILKKISAFTFLSVSKWLHFLNRKAQLFLKTGICSPGFKLHFRGLIRLCIL